MKYCNNGIYKTFQLVRHRFNKNIHHIWFRIRLLNIVLGETIKANSIYIFQIDISDIFRLIYLRINRFLTSLSQQKKKEIDGCTMIRVDIPDLQARVPGVWKTLDAMVLSTIRNLFPEWNLSGWNLFTVRSFFSSSSSSFSSRFRPSSHPLLQTRLDEDRPAFINHPLKRNPWRSIINDLATNLEEVPRPNKTWPAECILHFEIRARLTRNRRPDSLTAIFYLLQTLRRGTFTHALWFLKFWYKHRRIVDDMFIARRIVRNLENRCYL